MHKLAAFKEEIFTLKLKPELDEKIQEKDYTSDWRENVLESMKLNLYDYFYKSDIFTGVVLGLSGGIDSAFTAYMHMTAAAGPRFRVPTRSR